MIYRIDRIFARQVLFYLLLTFPVLGFAFEPPVRRQPKAQVKYRLSDESSKKEGVPESKLEGPFLFHSKIIENTVRKYWISVPSQYDPSSPACLLVFQDGARATNPTGELLIPQVLENLIANKAIPVTIGIYITPGQRGADFPDNIGTGNPDNRDREYDVLDDKYARMLTEELLPEVEAKYNLAKDPASRAIGGTSSGAICAFTVAWHKPESFRNVLSLIGSFTNIHGGHVYPQWIRDNPRKPIRIFLQDGENDNRNPNDLDRDWYLQNRKMVAALSDQNYDMAHVFGKGGHSDNHGAAMLPEMLQWIWRDYPGVEPKSAEALIEKARQIQPVFIDPFPGFDPSIKVSPIGRWKWESNGNRGKRTEVLVIEESVGDGFQGTIESSLVVDGEPQNSSVSIENIELIGNKLIFDAQREFRDRKMSVTYQGVINDKMISGWSIMDMNGTTRDNSWKADRITE